MRKLISACIILILSASCASNEKFKKKTVENLYNELKKENEFKSDLTQTILLQFLKNVNISALKKGQKFEHEYLFENFDCECQDNLSISYSTENNRFELTIYEESFEKDFDWCPETTYVFSFLLDKNQIKELKLDLIAG